MAAKVFIPSGKPNQQLTPAQLVQVARTEFAIAGKLQHTNITATYPPPFVATCHPLSKPLFFRMIVVGALFCCIKPTTTSHNTIEYHHAL
jgi:hypothetical protein